jgi:hypothetical protein
MHRNAPGGETTLRSPSTRLRANGNRRKGNRRKKEEGGAKRRKEELRRIAPLFFFSSVRVEPVETIFSPN